MSKKWRHGFNAGFDEGSKHSCEQAEQAFKDGYVTGAEHSMKGLEEAEQIDMLIEMMAYLFSHGTPDHRHWCLLRIISTVNSKNMLTPEKAWHLRKRSDTFGCSQQPITDSTNNPVTYPEI